MNQSHIKDYIEQAYNPGSPHPDPIVPLKSFKTLPKVDNIENDADSDSELSPVPNKKKCLKVKIKVPPARKRKSVKSFSEEEEDEGARPNKAAKMMNEQDLAKVVDMVVEKLKTGNQAIVESMTKLSTNFKDLNDQLEKDRLERAKRDERIDNLEKEVKDMKEAEPTQTFVDKVTDAIVPQVRKAADATTDAVWKNMLSKEVFEHEHSVIIHGLKISENVQDMFEFFKNRMKVPDDKLKKMYITKVNKIGFDTNNKVAPTVVRFSHPSERNEILGFSRNLPKGIYVDKHVPKAYINKHKEFKAEVRKLRALYGDKIQTQIIFEGPLIVVRYKYKDNNGMKYSYIIHDSWYPRPNEMTALTERTPRFDHQLTATTKLDFSEANRSIIVSNIKYKEEDLEKQFEEFFEMDDFKDRIEKMIVQKKYGRIIIYGNDWKACDYIVKKYDKKEFKEAKITMELFASKDPTADENKM